MGTDKRERQKANRAAKIEAEQAAEAKARRLKTIKNFVVAGVVIVAVMVLITVLSGCSSSAGSDGSKKDSSSYISKDDKDDGTDASTETTDASGDGSFPLYGTGACPPASGSSKPTIDFDAAPKKCIDPSKTYTATVKTSEGTVVLKLDTKRTPATVNNFVVLARHGYFDDTVFFRTEAQSGIIQGGSPHTQDNTDAGPGYNIADEGLPFSADDYAPGTIAMANTGQPNSGSAQFFFLANEGGRYLGDAAQLGPSAGSYAVFGKATKGLDVLEKIAALDDGTSVPSKKVTIESVTITES